MRKAGWLLLVASAATSAADPVCSHPPDPATQAALDDYSLAVAAQAVAGNDARQLVAAAAWVAVAQTAKAQRELPEAQDMFARAAELAGPDPVAWALLATACRSTCTLATDPQERWRTLDADNAAPWLAEADRALEAKDEDRAREALARAAQAPRFDWYWAAQVRASVNAARAVPVPPEGIRYAEEEGFAARDAADVFGMGMAFAASLPGGVRVVEACRAHADWQGDCARLGRLMEAKADTLLGRGIGRSMQRNVLGPDSAGARALAERDRVAQWRLYQSARLSTPEGMTRMLQRIAAAGAESEPRLVERLLRDAGVPLAPPTDWTVERGRADWDRDHPAPDADADARCGNPEVASKP